VKLGLFKTKKKIRLGRNLGTQCSDTGTETYEKKNVKDSFTGISPLRAQWHCPDDRTKEEEIHGGICTTI
jgi:hypothetical protein